MFLENGNQNAEQSVENRIRPYLPFINIGHQAQYVKGKSDL